MIQVSFELLSIIKEFKKSYEYFCHKNRKIKLMYLFVNSTQWIFHMKIEMANSADPN